MGSSDHTWADSSIGESECKTEEHKEWQYCCDPCDVYLCKHGPMRVGCSSSKSLHRPPPYTQHSPSVTLPLIPLPACQISADDPLITCVLEDEVRSQWASRFEIQEDTQLASPGALGHEAVGSRTQRFLAAIHKKDDRCGEFDLGVHDDRSSSLENHPDR